MIFEYDELKEAITEDFDRFYQMGFSETQLFPAILNEYKYGEDFCPTENICIHIFLALNYAKNGLNFKMITEKLNHLITEESESEIRAALGNESIKYNADLALLMKYIKGVLIMTDWTKLTANLEQRGFTPKVFATAAEAADYLDKEIDGVSVGFGGSMTVQEMGLYEKLKTHNETLWHWDQGTLEKAAQAEVYLCSVNGLAETGEIINIDGTGNRVASTLFGHKKVYLVVGKNKIAPDYDQALWRARNIASPKNAQRIGVQTPCAVKGDKCYDCKSPQRICRGLVVLWEKPKSIGTMEVILVDEELGY